MPRYFSRKQISLGIAMLIFLLFVVLTAQPLQVKADLNNPPPEAPGFPVDLSGHAIYEGSPTLADLDGDEELDIIIGGEDNATCRGRLYAISASGTMLWDIQTRAPINSTPAVDDIDNDGVQEVVVGLGTVESKNCANGGVLAVNGQTGAQEWIFDTQDWNGHVQNGFRDGVFSSPTIADFFGDDDKEIVFGAWDQCIYMVDSTGNPLWTWDDPNRCGGHGYYNEDTIWSSSAAADLTGDGILEIVIGADITEGNRNSDPTGGYLYVFDIAGNVLAREWLDQAIYSSPAIGDIDDDGELEIVVGTGVWVAGTGYYVTAWHFSPGEPVTSALVQERRWSTSGRVFTSPALADLNGNGGLDVIAIPSVGDGSWTGGADNGSKVFAWDGKTGNKLFETMVCDLFGNAFGVHSSPTVADIDGDGMPEILLSHAWEVSVLNHDGTHYTDYSYYSVNNPACDRTTEPSTDLTFWATWSVFGTPAVGDLTGDGSLEVVVGGGDGSDDDGKLYVWQPTGSGTSLPWPMFRHDHFHTGLYAIPPELSVAPTSIYVLHQEGETNDEQRTLLVSNGGGGSFDWSATVPSDVTLYPASGTVVTQTRVSVTISTLGYSAGELDLGSIDITAMTDGSSIAGSPVSIPVKLYVGQVYKIFLPMTIRSD
jgi:hypothetical protein